MRVIGEIERARACVYGLVFTDGDEQAIYVGVSSNVYNRIANHMDMLRRKTHTCKDLQVAFDEIKPITAVILADLDEYSNDAAVRLQTETEWAVKMAEKYKVISAHVYAGESYAIRRIQSLRGISS